MVLMPSGLNSADRAHADELYRSSLLSGRGANCLRSEEYLERRRNGDLA